MIWPAEHRCPLCGGGVFTVERGDGVEWYCDNQHESVEGADDGCKAAQVAIAMWMLGEVFRNIARQSAVNAHVNAIRGFLRAAGSHVSTVYAMKHVDVLAAMAMEDGPER